MRQLGSALVAGLVLGACSLLVGPEKLPIRCEGSTGCPDGTQCRDGVCRPGEPDGGCAPDVDPDDPNPDPDGPERCDGQDNDCDGKVDEGNDQDGDGTTWCGGGDLHAPRDCDDNDPTRSPELSETCNGIDDNCDGERDNGVCPEGEICFPDGRCAPPDCSIEGCAYGLMCKEVDDRFECLGPESPCSKTPCPQGTCDEETGLCLGSIGQTCVNDVDCEEGLCLAPSALRLSEPESRCSRLCCGPSDCPAGTLCWQPGGGLSACVPKELLDLDGVEPDGATCRNDGDCSGGTCVQGTCSQVCCDEASCSGQLECNLAGLGDETHTVCTEPSGGGLGDWCLSNADCESACLGDGYCTIPCCTSDQCGEGFVCREFSTDSGGIVRLCMADEICDAWDCAPRHGEGRAGEACHVGEDCRSDACEQSVCVDTCCVPSDCPAGTECRVQLVEFGAQLRCRPVEDGPR